MMRHLLKTALIGLGLTGGVAMADGVRVDVHANGPRVEESHYRDVHRRPVVRVEKYETRRGYRWHPGAWRWESGEWQWHGGWYVRG
jgi:hypothetical protein